MTQPAQQPPAGPPPQSTQQGGQQPPPDAPPAVPAPNQQPPQQWPNLYGQPHPVSPQQPPPPAGWPPPPVPGQQPQPYPHQPYGGQPWPQPYGQPAPAPGGQPSTPGQPQQQPTTGDPGQGSSGDDGQGDGDQGQGYDLSRLPKAAREEIQRLRQLTRERETQLRAAQVSQHAYGAAQAHGVNPQALLGSLAWQQAAAQLDPNAADYQQRLAWTVQAIAAQNPWMAAQQGQQQQPPPPPAQSGGDFSAGTGAGTPITEAQLAQMSPEEINQAFEEGKLKHLL